MRSSLRSKTFPKSRHFGFKRPVFIEPAKEDDKEEKEKNNVNLENKENDENKQEQENKIDTNDEIQSENQTSSNKNKIHLLSFSISTDLLSIQEAPSTPGFDWIHESESKERLFNDSNFFFDEEFNKGIGDNLDSSSIF